MPSPKEREYTAKVRAEALRHGAFECELCTWAGWKISTHLRSGHRMTLDDYQARFPNAPTLAEKPKSFSGVSFGYCNWEPKAPTVASVSGGGNG